MRLKPLLAQFLLTRVRNIAINIKIYTGGMFFWYRCHQIVINAFLLGVVVISLSYALFGERIGFYPAQIWTKMNTNHERYQQYLDLLKSVLSVIALFIAGLWTYYKFIKGRTFSPKLAINISVMENKDTTRSIVLVRIKLENVSNVRIGPRSATVKFDYGAPRDGQIEYKSLNEEQDLLSFYYSNNEIFHVEPKDVMTIDVPVVTDEILKDSKHTLKDYILRVKVDLEDHLRRHWKERVVLYM